MDDVVAELRERLERRRTKPSLEALEDRLRRACLDGSGHLMITGSDRAEIHRLLGRVLDDLAPLSAIRTLAVDSDPYATVDRVISAFAPDAALDNYLDRRAALLELLARAEEADKAIFVVVDDADRATIEQLERLRSSLEIAPQAIERLRLVFVGDETLPTRLEDPAARALRTRIAATVRMDEPMELRAPTTPRRKTAASHALTFAVMATVTFCTAVYAMYLVGLMTGGSKRARVAHATGVDAAPPSRGALYALRGDEQFLESPLRIDAVVTSRKKIAAPPPASAAKPPAAATAPVANAGRPTRKAPVPTKPATAPVPAPGSSIDAVMKRFR
jgi:hypothetical protein